MLIECIRPEGFNAAVLAAAFPADHEYRIALFDAHVSGVSMFADLTRAPMSFAELARSTDPFAEPEPVNQTPQLEKTLTGYELVQDSNTASIRFETQVEWLNVTVTAMCAIVYDSTTGIIMSITNFEKPVGVINGLFEMTLNSAGVVRFGDSL